MQFQVKSSLGWVYIHCGGGRRDCGGISSAINDRTPCYPRVPVSYYLRAVWVLYVFECVCTHVHMLVRGVCVEHKGQVVRWLLQTLAQSMEADRVSMSTASTNIPLNFTFTNFSAVGNALSAYLAGGRRNAESICSLKTTLVFQPDWKIAVDLGQVGECLHLEFWCRSSLRLTCNFLVALLRPPTSSASFFLPVAWRVTQMLTRPCVLQSTGPSLYKLV